MNETTMKRMRVAPLTLLRIGVGIIMLAHGVVKLWDLSATTQQFASMGLPAPALSAALATVGEIAGGAGLILGLFTPVASLLVLATMAVAVLFVHLPNGLFAKNGGFEYPLTLALVSLYFAVRGAGPVSVDAWIAKRRSGDDAEPSMARKALGQHSAAVGR